MQSVVSGSADPDVFVINRSVRNNNLNIVQRKNGEKNNCVLVSDSGDVNTSEVDINKRNQLCLSDDELLKLSEIGIYLEQNFRSPRDIEWAIHNNIIYLLQSRPMTSTHAFTSWELLHEFDTPVMTDEDLMTFGNTGEVFPLPVSTLSMTSNLNVMSDGLVEVITHKKPLKFFKEMISVTHHRVGLTIFNTFTTHVEKEVTFENRAHALLVFGHQFLDDKANKIAAHRNGYGTKWHKLYMMYDAFKTCRSLRKGIEDLRNYMVKNVIERYSTENLSKFDSMIELYKDLVKSLYEMQIANKHHLNATKANTIYEMVVFASLAEGSKGK